MSEPRSSANYAVHKVNANTWAVNKKAVPGFRLAGTPKARNSSTVSDSKARKRTT